MNASRRAMDRIADIHEAIRNIEFDTDGYTRDRFLADGKTQRAVIESLMVIGEAGRRLLGHMPDLPHTHPEIAEMLIDAGDMRNLLAHEYFRVDADILWATLSEDLPPLRSALDTLGTGIQE